MRCINVVLSPTVLENLPSYLHTLILKKRMWSFSGIRFIVYDLSYNLYNDINEDNSIEIPIAYTKFTLDTFKEELLNRTPSITISQYVFTLLSISDNKTYEKYYHIVKDKVDWKEVTDKVHNYYNNSTSTQEETQ